MAPRDVVYQQFWARSLQVFFICQRCLRAPIQNRQIGVVGRILHHQEKSQRHGVCLHLVVWAQRTSISLLASRPSDPNPFPRQQFSKYPRKEAQRRTAFTIYTALFTLLFHQCKYTLSRTSDAGMNSVRISFIRKFHLSLLRSHRTKSNLETRTQRPSRQHQLQTQCHCAHRVQ